MTVGRLQVNRLKVDRTEGRVTVEVELVHDGQALVGQGEAVDGTASLAAAAAATVSALNRGLPDGWRLRVDEAVTQHIAEHLAVIVQVRLRSEEVEERLVGSAVTDRIPEEAAVRAVLNAAERRAMRLMEAGGR